MTRKGISEAENQKEYCPIREIVIYCRYGVIMLQGGSLPLITKRREVVRMDTYQILSLLFLGGNFLIALLAYIDRNNKRK